MKRRNLSIVQNVSAIIVSLVILLPILWTAIASIMPERQLISVPLRWIPSELDFSRYKAIFTGGDEGVGGVFRAAMLNSLAVSSLVVIISIVVGVFGGYAFARLKFRFKRAVLLIFLSTYMMPQIALVIPLYMILNSLGMLDTIWGLALVDLSLAIPFVLWIMSNYFVTIPIELEEAARVDGTSRMGALFRIIIPCARPGIIAAMMFAFLLIWDEFMYSLIFTSSTASKTIPVAISEFSGRYTTDFGLVAAGGLLAALPPVILAIVFQKYIVSGMAAGAVKG